MSAAFCCAQMRLNSTVRCDEHKSEPWNCPDVLVLQRDGDLPGLPIRDGGSSFMTIRYCPWCGTNLRPKPCRAHEDMTGIGCKLEREGHPLPHRGWWRDDADTDGDYAVYIEWPAPTSPNLDQPAVTAATETP